LSGGLVCANPGRPTPSRKWEVPGFKGKDGKGETNQKSSIKKTKGWWRERVEIPAICRSFKAPQVGCGLGAKPRCWNFILDVIASTMLGGTNFDGIRGLRIKEPWARLGTDQSRSRCLFGHQLRTCVIVVSARSVLFWISNKQQPPFWEFPGSLSHLVATRQQIGPRVCAWPQRFRPHRFAKRVLGAWVGCGGAWW